MRVQHFRINPLFPSKTLLLGVLFSMVIAWNTVDITFAKGVSIEPGAPNVKEQLIEIENSVYGKTYPDQSTSKRINRLERSLFGQRRAGQLESRLLDLQNHQKKHKRNETKADANTVISYLEKKLFQQEFREDPMPERLNQLETHVFGKTFEAYPTELRTKKLMYTVPVLAKSVRLSSEGIVVASTAKQTEDHTKTTNKELKLQTPVRLSSAGSIPNRSQKTPDGETISRGSYYHNIYQHQPGKVLRWGLLPVQVYIKNASNDETQLTIQVIEHWNQFFQFAVASQEGDADVIIDWQKSRQSAHKNNPAIAPIRKLLKRSEPVSAPVPGQIIPARNTGKKSLNIQTVVLFNAGVLSHLSPSECHHSLAHGLGHAVGLWGHSNNPNDIMYPLLQWQQQDIPANWLRRSNNISSLRDTRKMLDPQELPKITQRDINTLTKIYKNEGLSLKAYNP